MDYNEEVEALHRDSLDNLLALLDDGEFLAYLERQPATIFSDDQKAMVRRWATHLAPTASNKRKIAGSQSRPSKKRDIGDRGKGKTAAKQQEDDKGADEDDEGDEGAAGVKEPANDWKPILDIKELTIGKDTHEQLEKFQDGGSVADFLLTRADRDYPGEIWDSEAPNPAKSLASLLINTDKLTSEVESNYILFLFIMLLWHHVKEMLVPGAGSGHTFSLGKLQLVKLRDQLTLIHSQSDDWPADWTVERTCKHIREWAKLGFKIDILTSEFGPGCLFVLFKPLTEAFLLRKITKSGRTHHAAIRHLEDLGLREYLQEEGLDVFGDAIVNYLLRPFAEATRTKDA
ncbi:uncharacterized protein N0V89_007619 [Didymosphaeria variabile]|uniref:Uncharacterized protein n=1 Tax=Didymosphaeria variabile TaxID=1932322 RepID=A0A9W9CAM6_9PLEO|nr:uncharacterized protein N0V89_007619 [Didymosphaeria variabile]KAJ4352272.1 hypothetical protein N0V89_007619 [Didymosphaeria variabile]